MLSPASNYSRYLQDVPNDYSRRPQPVSQRAVSPASSVCLQPAAGVKFRVNISSEQSFGAELTNGNVPYIKESVWGEEDGALDSIQYAGQWWRMADPVVRPPSWLQALPLK